MTPPRWQRGTGHVPPALIGELAGRAAAADGVAAISGHVLEALDAGEVDALLRFDQDGAVVGAAVATGADPGEVVVAPAARRRGHGSALVAAALDRQGAVWAYGDLPAAVAIARRLELVRGRVLLQMRRRGPWPTSDVGSALPVGVRLRTFVPGQDEAAFLGVNARAFAWHPEQGRLDLAGLRGEMAQEWFDPAGFFLAVTAGDGPEQVLGFHWTKVHPTDPNPGLPDPGLPNPVQADPGLPNPVQADPGLPNPVQRDPVQRDPGQPNPGQPDPGRDEAAGPIGEIYVLGVDPEAGIRGLGTPLTEIGLDHLRRRGLETVMLYVEGDNDRARRLYERFGFTTFLSNVVYARAEPVAR